MLRHPCKTLLFSCLLLSVTGCIETEPANCAEHPEREVCVEACRRNPTDPACPGDAGADTAADASDAAADAGQDAGPCGPCPTGQVCEASSGTCRDCLTNEDCSGDLLCDTEAYACVHCLSHDDCTDPNNAQCDSSGDCVPCSDNSHCAGTDRPICSAEGTCIECDPSNEADVCDGKACDILAGTCSAHDLGSARLCEPCVSDAQCQGDAHCVPMEYMGEPHGAFCLNTNAGGCTNKPFSIGITGRTSVSGVTGAAYCGINEALTTCEAVRALLEDMECPEGTECPEGGLCRTVGRVSMLPNRCTYECNGPAQCQAAPNPGSSCGSGDTGGVSYCGG